MNITAIFKRGDTFSLQCTYKDSAGAPASVTGLTINSQIRNSYGGTLVATLTAVPLDQTTHVGQFNLVPVVSDTSGWPVGNLICDLQITNGTTVRSSDSFIIPVVEDVTQ